MNKKTHILLDDGERVLWRQVSSELDGRNELIIRFAAERPMPASLDRLSHEFELRDELDSAWAVRPLRLVYEGGQALLAFEDPGGELLANLLGKPLEIEGFLELAIAIVSALGELHRRGLVHKDLKPAHIFVQCADGRARLTGFGLASRLPRERQAPEPPETIAGTLAYMAPEQTGRMNRSIDSRSDLYALGVTLYQMLAGVLPFAATDAMEWVHCHVARTPLPPRVRVASVPSVISRIVMKLLAKTAEERYQTAAGIEQDLRRCLVEWRRQRRIDDFALDEKGAHGWLMIPERLYGREREVDALIATFGRILENGTPELVLVSGYSGIGKSSVVNELQKTLVQPRGLFASGKFDQYKRDVPYSTLIQALQGLVRMLLGKSDIELASWRTKLLDVLSPNTSLISDLIPELKHITGDTPPVPELEPLQAKQRFLHVFARFISVFARAEHPLALFLDDLQWLDAATLDILPDLLTHPDLHHLMLIGAYRDNEVDATHPLTSQLEAIRKAGAQIRDIRLAPLTRAHIGNLISDALHCAPESAEPLACLVRDKTDGNPFFVIQFLQALAENNLLTFDHDVSQWLWDSDRIHAKGYTDNVVDLMARKLVRLPSVTQYALQQLACLGNVADIGTLSAVLGLRDEKTHSVLWEAVRQELVEQMEGAYSFVHDRIHEAAYSLIPQAARAETHLQIGRLLFAQTPAEKREEAIFEIVGQLNRGAILISEWEERERLAELNLRAGLRARASTAFASALAYFTTGTELISADGWERRHDLLFALELNRAQCEFLTNQLLTAKTRLLALSERASTTVEWAHVTGSKMDLHVILDQSDKAVAVGLVFLRHVGIEWSAHPDKQMVRAEYEHIGELLGDRAIKELIDLRPMESADAIAIVEVLMKLFPPALFTDENLSCLTICKVVSLSLEHGNADVSCIAYSHLPKIAGRHFGDYQAGLQFGRLSCKLVELRGLECYEARTYLPLATTPWVQPMRTGPDELRRIFHAANRVADVTWSACTSICLISNLFFIGEPLVEVQREAESYLAYARKIGFGMVIHMIQDQLALIRMLRGMTLEFGYLNDGQVNEAYAEKHYPSSRSLTYPACWYWIRKLQARYLAGDYEAAIAAASEAQRFEWAMNSFIEEVEYHFYGALSLVHWCKPHLDGRHVQHLEALFAHYNELSKLAELRPEDFTSHTALVGAEIARLEGRVVDAETLYEKAIASAQEAGFVPVEALACELASGFYAARGLRKIARMYMQDARYGYLRWSANGKVLQLEEQYPYLRTEERAPEATKTMATPIEHLELATVIKVSQAASGEIHLEKLIEMVMHIAIEQAGAERGVLILSDGDSHRITAEATTSDGELHLQLSDTPIATTVLPESILNQVLRTHAPIFLDDAATDPISSADSYVRQHRARSILCLPLLNCTKLIGALYLENNLAARVFSPSRIAVLKLVALQAAISLENARLYRNVAEREARIRRLVDANIIGIVIWGMDGRLLDANDSFLRMVQYGREDLEGGMRWFDLTPPEWQEVHLLVEAEELRSTGMMQPREKEFFRRDGSRVPVLIGGAAFEDQPNQGVAYILDLTDLKRAEAEAHASGLRYQQLLGEMAHANRIAVVGQLSAAISHDVRQPLVGVVASGSAGLNWLATDPPNIPAARSALERVVSEGHRAAEVLERTRALVRKVPPKIELVSIDSIVSETVKVIAGEATRLNVRINVRFEAGASLVLVDRVQLQQVIVNLSMNAIEAMREVPDTQRELSLRTFNAMEGRVRVEVRDTGPGVSGDAQNRLFGSFYSTKPDGMGMGLPISRSIVEAHGSELNVDRNEPRGAVFWFSLLVVQEVA